MEDYLPLGFRFYPTEAELVSFYLQKKLDSGRDDHDLNKQMDQVIPVLDIYDFNPWDLPQFAGELCKKDPEQWFFFVARQESEARGGRPKRLTTTGSGYWKATGSPNYVYSSENRSIGVKRTMVFYKGKAPKGTKTDWKMNEYKAISGAVDRPSSSSSSTSNSSVPRLRHELSLCRIYKKSKTLRSFDRRPQPPLPPPQEAEMAQPATGLQPQTQNPNPPLMEAERASSPETSSSGDGNGHISQETTNMESQSAMDVDNELMWDWNHLNWY